MAAFALTQIVGYGVLFYAFGVFIAPIAEELHTSTTAVTGALTVCIMVSALASVPVGRWLDRHGGRALMTAGSVLGTAGVLAWSEVDTIWQLYAVFVLIGLSHAAVLYDAAFTVVVKQVAKNQRARSILVITVVAGFAGTVFIPLAGWLGQTVGWRDGLLVLATIHGALTIGPHFFAVPRKTGLDLEVARAPVVRDGVFWLLAVAFTSISGAIFAVAVHLVGYLRELGHPIGVAATVTGLVGVMSVTGRLVMTGLTARLRTATVVSVLYLAQALAIVLLPVAGHNLVGAIACVLVFGLGFGITNIAKPLLLAERYGVDGYGAISGLMATPATVAKAMAPLAVAAMSVWSLPYLADGCCAVAAVCLTASARAPLPA